MLKMIGTAILGLALALPVAFAPGAAHAQDQNGVLGQVQRFFNPNQPNYNEHRRTSRVARTNGATASTARTATRRARSA